MKNIVKDMERFTEAVNTIEELLPNVRGYLVMAMDRRRTAYWHSVCGSSSARRTFPPA